MKLEIKNVAKAYKNKKVVNNFNMEMRTGECVGLIGPNGAGKSTLIKMIADIIKPDNGEIILNGTKITNMKKEIGYLPQYPAFYNWMTAKETLEFMGQLSCVKKAELTLRIPEILRKVGLHGAQNDKVGTFSGGMKQRLGIAQALLHKPSLVIMDEPVSALDPIGRREVLNIIQDIKKETTILFSTHILNDAEEICERFVVMKEGLKLEDTTTSQLIYRQNEDRLSLELATNDLVWIDIVKTLPYVKEVKVMGKRLEIMVENLSNNKKQLLSNAIEHNVDIMRFEIRRDTLEEIFLKMVVSE
ncbi:ABC transporter ATP-binding protein [Ureibacillus sinduriensis]|uniref:ABC transporter ATP-binding protein n=1 Tax=Ureibacillus sinduriensis BLB-1 = JCM 15800 TaxID=1384057 RepID=A0A0A3HV82_9BACL|nr:ABC transporter ATP-binding protein [Ureibacillus sinduriensis]KGR74218.1 ABC transporter ATP-binding protein [Ureibacillus sinduriensis BLB-1 = JCM 15800]